MKPTLYLFVGYPGAGKTTVARIITQLTGGVHLWADFERHVMFDEVTHATEESKILYSHLNRVTNDLLEQGKCVIFDTNFNFRKDRDFLRGIAAKYDADAVVVWVTTPKEVAMQRALDDQNLRNGYEVSMSAGQFEDLTNKLEEPGEDEHVVRIDGETADEASIKAALDL
jgi:predicted kinase